MKFLTYLKEKNIDYSVEDDGKIVVKEGLDLSCTPITELPENLSVGGDLELQHTKITKLPERLSVNGNLSFYYAQITKLPDSLSVSGWLSLRNTQLTKLPDDLYVGGSLNLKGTKITELPDDFSVSGSLNLSETPITELPDGLLVYGTLNLNHTQITELPEGLSVGGNLDLRNTQITKLPEGLSVGEWIRINNTKITKLPDNLSVGSGLSLDAEKITNIAYHKDCKWRECPIFATYVNNKIQISASHFLGSIKAFEAMVDKFLSVDFINHTDANKCKQAARECIKELEEMRKDKTKLKKIHELKISSQHFKDVVSGAKTAEIRYRDRDYQVGDQLILQEYDEGFTGASYRVFITHILKDEKYLQKGYVMLSIKNSEELSLLPNPRTIFR